MDGITGRKIMDSSEDKTRFFTDEPGSDVYELLGTVPGRWGRMSPLCRLLIYEVGSELLSSGRIRQSQRLVDLGKKCGLIGATKRGSLFTDEAFISTMQDGPGLASPALFGYTLPNIPLAEAAAVFGLVGPVYAVFEEHEPLHRAIDEARLLLKMQDDLDYMLACSFDHYREDGQEIFNVTIKVVDRT